MRLAILSDIHSNLQAWDAVYLDLRSSRVDRIICLGDVVGYGPNPAEVLQKVHAHADSIVLGNHDAVVCGKLDAELFNDTARHLIEWTMSALGANAIDFLRSLPLSLNDDLFRCAHAGFVNPGAFDYVIEPADALACWQAVPNQLLFMGHTHQPALFLLGQSGTPHLVEPQDFEIEPGKRYLVNVGSAGQPRDGDARASYCILDTSLNAVYWRRVPFDLDAYRQAVERAGIPAEASYFLSHDPRRGRPPLRELLDFAPPTSVEKRARDVVEVQELNTLKRRVKTWRIFAAVTLLIAAATAACAGYASWRTATRALVLSPPELHPIVASELPPESSLLPPPDRATPAGEAVPGWIVALGDRRSQSVSIADDGDSGRVIRLASANDKDEIAFTSPPIRVKPGMAFYPDALFRKSPDFRGVVAMTASLDRSGKDGQNTSSQFYVKEPNQARPDGWVRARQRFEIPAGGRAIQFSIRGRFTGTVDIKDLTLTCRQTSEATASRPSNADGQRSPER